jgi:hypothetical protein
MTRLRFVFARIFKKIFAGIDGAFRNNKTPSFKRSNQSLFSRRRQICHETQRHRQFIELEMRA